MNGVLQREGADFRVEDRALVFARELRQEGKLGFWRWASILFGAAGTYRQNDVVDVIYGRRAARGCERPPRRPQAASQTAWRRGRRRAAARRARPSARPARAASAQLPSGSPGVFIRPSLPRPSTSCAGIMQRAAREESASSISSHGSPSREVALSVSVSWVVV